MIKYSVWIGRSTCPSSARFSGLFFFFVALANPIVSPASLCFTLSIPTLSSSARLHDHLNTCATEKTRRGQAGSKRNGIEGGRQVPFRPAHFTSSGHGWREGGQHRHPGEVRKMARGLLCSAHLRHDHMRFVLKNVPSQHRAYHSERQGRWMTLRVICWELEWASRTDAGHQQPPALTAPILPGEGTGKLGISTNAETEDAIDLEWP